MTLSLWRQNQVFAEIYGKAWEALRKSQVGPPQLVSAKAYQDNLVKGLEPILAKLLTEVGTGSGVGLKIFVAYVRSSLLHYDGRVDLYLRGTWFVNNPNGITPNIDTERKINRILWEPEIGEPLPWIHLLQHVTDSGNLVLLAGSSQVRSLLEEHWNTVSLDQSVEAAGRKIPNIKSDLTDVLSDEGVKELLEQVKSIIIPGETIPLHTLFANDKQKAVKALINPVRVMAKFSLSHLIYLPLLSCPTGSGRSDEEQRPSALDGGAVLTVKLDDNRLDLRALKEYLENLRGALRQCLVFPTLCAEDRFQEIRRETQEESYYERYYNPARPPEIPLVDHLKQQSSNPPRAAGPLFGCLATTLDELIRKNVRGPRDIAEYAFDGIRNLWEKWNTAKTNSPDGNIKTLLDLLKKLLDFEEQLKYVPGYREHFVHSIHVLVLGMILVAKLDPFSVWRENGHFWKSWFITALFHDFGIPVAKAPEAIEELIRQDFQLTTIEHLLKPEITWHKLLLEENFHKMLRNKKLQQLLREHPRSTTRTSSPTFCYEAKDGKRKIQTHNLSLILSKYVAQHFPGKESLKYDHGIVSALLLYSHSCKGEKYWPRWQKAMRAAVLPVMLHHYWDLETHNWDLETHKRKEQQTPSRTLFIHPHEGFLLYLLTLCDAVCQQGRSFEGFQAKGIRSPIRLADLQFRDSESARITLDYREWRSQEDQKDLVNTLWQRYMQQPKDFFCFPPNDCYAVAVTINQILDSNFEENLKNRITSVEWKYIVVNQ